MPVRQETEIVLDSTAAAPSAGGSGRPTNIVTSVIDLLYPPRCPLCDDSAAAGTLCRTCSEAITRARRAAVCPRCAGEVAPFEVRDGRCPRCRRRRPHLKAIVRVGRYEDALSGVLMNYKYRGREHLGRTIGTWMVETVASAPWRSRVEAVVFVPSLWRRRVMRPYYAAESLARLVAGSIRLPLLPLLRRIRGGSHQIGLSFPQRVENVRGAFAMARGATMQRAKLLLIDDVMTTGATLNECAKVLRRAGAEEVYGAVVVTVDANRTPEALRSF